jgi:DNA-binding beta-propeller fold protein YncE
MSLRRVCRLAAIVLPTLLWVACGQVYRPVVIPCSEGNIPGCPVEAPPTPSSFHAVFAISTNAPNNAGGAMQIDVSGDSIIAETPTSDQSEPNLGDNPTHMAILPNDSMVFVASAGSVLPGGIDLVSSFTPAIQTTIATGFGPVNTISLPTGSQPVFLNTTQNNALYVANFGTNSVSAINTFFDLVSNSASVGLNPVALAETPNGTKLYVANQGDNSVSTLNTTTLSPNTANGLVTGFTGVTPVWAVARGDSQKVYVLTQGDGQLVTIDTATDTVTSSLSVGVGANFLFYDSHLNRLYVTNPSTGVYIFSDTGGANDTPILLTPAPLTIPGLSATTTTPACTGCSAPVPISVTALPDGSRFYVASYQCQGNCATTTSVIPVLTVFNANNLAPQYPNAPTMTLLTSPFAANQIAVPSILSCVSPVFPALYAPNTTRFRVFTTASADSTHVYVSMCDAGAIADINTTGSNTNGSGGTTSPVDTLVTDMPAAFGAGTVQPNGYPPNQSPIFLLTGQ